MAFSLNIKTYLHLVFLDPFPPSLVSKPVFQRLPSGADAPPFFPFSWMELMQHLVKTNRWWGQKETLTKLIWMFFFSLKEQNVNFLKSGGRSSASGFPKRSWCQFKPAACWGTDAVCLHCCSCLIRSEKQDGQKELFQLRDSHVGGCMAGCCNAKGDLTKNMHSDTPRNMCRSGLLPY